MTDPIKLAYNLWQESAQKLDYFLIGLSSAVFAYEAQYWSPAILGCNPPTIELIGILFVLASLVFGVLRVEAFMFLFGRSHKHLLIEAINNRNVSALAQYDLFEEVVDRSGEIIAKDHIQEQAKTSQDAIGKSKAKQEILIRRAEIYYRCRNWLLLLGFMIILLSKVLSPYWIGA